MSSSTSTGSGSGASSTRRRRSLPTSTRRVTAALGACRSNGFDDTATKNAIAHLAQDQRSRSDQYVSYPPNSASEHFSDTLLGQASRSLVVFNASEAEVLEADPLALDDSVLRHRTLGQHADGTVAAEIQQDIAAVEEEKVARLGLALGRKGELRLQDLGRGPLDLLERAHLCQGKGGEAGGIEPLLLLPAAPLEGHLLLLEGEGRHERLASLTGDRGRQLGVLDVFPRSGVLANRHDHLRELVALGAHCRQRLLDLRGIGGRRRARRHEPRIVALRAVPLLLEG